MSLQTVVISLFLTIAMVASGCGRSKVNHRQDGEQKMNTATKDQSFFPETTFEPIEFESTRRIDPDSASHALEMLASIDQLYQWQRIPEALNKDLTADSVYQFVKAWKLLKQQIPNDVTWLKKLAGSSVPGADRIQVQQIDNKKKQLLDWLENRLPQQMANRSEQTRNFLKSAVQPMMWNHIQKAADCDMANQSQVANTLSRPELNALRASQIRNVDLAYTSLEMFDREMAIESNWATPKAEFRTMVARYQDKLELASDAIQLPADIGDESLKKIAMVVLSNPKYKLPKPETLVVNAAKRSFGKDHYTIDFGERAIDKSEYRWEEFQVATVEQHGDQYYLWYNTILNYSVGPHTVPTGKWVLGPRHKGAPISKSNF